MTICVTSPVKPHHKAMLEAAAGEHTVLYGKEHLARAEIVIGDVGPTRLATAKNLRWYHLVWAGIDRFTADNFPAGARFTNGSDVYGVMIAEHMMACMLALVRQLRHYDENQQAHRWDRDWSEDTLEGKTVLILGAGDIGTQLARRLRGFDCRIIGIRRTEGDAPFFDEVYNTDKLDDLLPEADIVACALPGTPLTRGLLDKNRLLRMKKTALLLNCGRGSLIDTKALEEVLADGHLGGVALDVTDPEPLPEDSPLWDCRRVILTPHISGSSFGHVALTEDKVYRLAAENLKRYLAGEPLLNEVDFETGYRRR
ncbi:MAG: D-2-hydroxyacid dehydrogenase [Clostridia bacterium]|nr:D-2-hydroxyacid dehydrogenase [Clostridia bacterium]